jgi:predicted oxidoreductase
MKKIKFGTSKLAVPAVSVGCMRLASCDDGYAQQFIGLALEKGLNFFDHADIYGDGESERKFGRAIKNIGVKREDIFVESKCGIVPSKMYDLSYEHIVSSVDGILNRLDTDYLDMLLLHRPDALFEPEEVAKAFEELETKSKVRHFGVSNMNPMQIELLKKYVKQPIVANQLQLSVTNSSMISSGLEVNMLTNGAVNRDGNVLDYCRLNDITIQTWSPFQYGFFEGTFLGSDKFPKLNEVINDIAAKYCVANTSVAAAWIMRHPANMQLIAGTMNPNRLDEIIDGSKITLTREEWYKIYLAAGNILP